MTLVIKYAARSDVGLLREGNEDSAYAGPRLLAVADGMGGHAHGEVASAVAISTLAPLDEDVPGADLTGALEAAIRDANSTLHQMVGEDPSLEGMGTTLTAMLWSGGRVGVAHIGDSRAYLLRDGDLYQITRDHTLVQQLVDEGRITLEEAATHPQRSLLLRALDGRGEVEPETNLREAKLGDRYLLCSDGLSAVVSADTLLRTLSTVPEPEQATRELIDLANRGGGPDNITCIVADVVESGDPIPDRPVVAGAAANSTRPAEAPQNTPASRARDTLTGPTPTFHEDDDDEEDEFAGDEPRPRRRRWPWAFGAVILVLIVAGLGYAGYRYTQGQYYLGVSPDSKVVVFQGVDQKVGSISLSKIVEDTGVDVSALPVTDQANVRANTMEYDSRAAAHEHAQQLKRNADACKAAAKARQQPKPKPRRSGHRIVTPSPSPTPSAPAGCPGVA